MQELVNEAEHDAKQERYIFSSTKTRAVVTKKGSNNVNTSLVSLHLNGQSLEITDQEKHLGIQRNKEVTNAATIQERITTARRTAYSLMGAGLHGLNGVNPDTSKMLWELYVTPALLHGLEALCITEKDYTQIENFYRENIKCYQHLPSSTANAASYLLVGATPVTGQLHKRILTFFVNMLRREDSTERYVLQRQLSMKDLDSHSWTVQVRNLLKMYQLPAALTILENTPPKGQWKRMLNEAVRNHWDKSLKDEAITKSTLKHLNLDACNMATSHPVWQLSKRDKINVSKAMVHAKLLVGRYPLMGGSTRTRGTSTQCPLCKLEPETLEHFLLECSSSQHIREQCIKDIKREISREMSATTDVEQDEAIVKAILDPSWFASGPTSEERFVRSRDLCFRLHHYRSVKTTGVSRYALAKRRGIVGGGPQKNI
jgi:hypothetical protein